MPFSKEDKALIKNLHQFKGYGSWRLLTEFPEINRNKRNSLLKRFGKQEALTEGTGVADRERQTEACAY